MIAEKFASLRYERFLPGAGSTPSPVADLERLIGAPLPEDFREFLVTFPDTGVFDIIVNCNGRENSPFSPDGVYHLSLMFGVCERASEDIVENFRNPPGAWDYGSDYLAIASNSFGDAVIMGLAGERAGKIFYWLHDPAPSENQFVLLANDFTEFVERLEAEPE